MPYISIVKTENNRITKFAEYAELKDAEAHCEKYGGFVYEGNFRPDLFVEGKVVTVKPEPEAPEQVIARLESAIDQHLDFVARSCRYESIRTMVTYASSDHPTFGAEGRAAVKFRDACYAYGIQAIADVQGGERGIPTEVELIAELPTFESFLGT